MKKVLFTVAATMLLAQPVLAQDAPAFNTDFQPSPEVAPGKYGAVSTNVKSKFDLSIGGFVKLDYAYNSVNLGGDGQLLPNGSVPKHGSVASTKDQSVFSARQSRFWLKSSGPTFLGAKTNGLLEFDFYGAGGSNESANLRMRHAYGSLDWKNTQLLFGQTSDIFAPMIVSTVDFRHGQATGTPFQPRVPQLRLTQKVSLGESNSLKFVLGAQNAPQYTNTHTGAATATDTWGSAVNGAGQVMFSSKVLGSAPGFYGMSMNTLTAGLFGLAGKEDAIVAGKNLGSTPSWGYGAYLFAPIIPSRDGKDRTMTLGFEGQTYLASNMKFNSATAADFAGTGGAKGYGLAGQLIFYPTANLGVTGGYEKRNAVDAASYKGTTNYERTNELMFANVAYDLNAAVRVATEYERQRSVFGNNKAGESDSGKVNVARVAFYYFF